MLRSNKTIISIFLVFALCFLLSIVLPGNVLAAEETFNWKLASCWPPANTLVEADRYFADLVEELSGGQLKIKVHPAPELVSPNEVLDAVERGSVEMGGDWPGYWAGRNEAFNIIASYPMGLTQYHFINWYNHYGGKKLIQELYGNYGVKYFVHNVIPMQSGFRGNEPIKSLEDYEGKTLRLSGKAQGYVLEKLGASQVNLSTGEVYQALQLGTIDGGEVATPSIDWDLGFGEVTKYYNGPGWHEPSAPYGIMINQDAWDSLPDHLKSIVEVACQASMNYMSSWYEVEDIEAKRKFAESGTEVFLLNESELKEIEKIINEYTEKVASENEDFRKIATSYFQYQKDIEPVYRDQGPFSHGSMRWEFPDLPGLE